VIDPHAPEPAYQQLVTLLRAEAARRKSREQMPSITELVEETGLAVGTIRKAVRVLADEGLVYTVPGRGTFKA
jgi:GntR family transcriptional regulator